jgi:NAD-binding of NADP-dependent 3-hydroxyisobutyrate dehydrogenase
VPKPAAKVTERLTARAPPARCRIRDRVTDAAGARPLVLDLPEQAWFDVQLMHKDIRLALEAARESRVPLPAAPAAGSVLSQAEEMGYRHREIAGLFQVLAAAAAEPAPACRPGKPAMNPAGTGPRAA